MRIVYKTEVSDTLTVVPLETVNKTVDIDSTYLLNQSKEVQEFYGINQYKTAWADKDNREQLIRSLEEIKYDGIPKNIFPTQELISFDNDYSSLTDSLLIEADLLYTKTFNKITQSLFNGLLDPRKLYNDWDLEYHQINTAATLILVLDNNAVLQAFDSIRPRHEQYGRYRQKIKNYYALQADSLKPTDTIAQVGQSYKEVIPLKKSLHFIGKWQDSLEINPIYTQELQNTLAQLQKEHKLSTNGQLDSQSIDIIEKEKQTIYEKLIVNAERFRWFPRKYGKDYILVNIPEFTLVSVANLDTIQKHNVIVGTTQRSTPILSSTLTTLVLNPTWTVPPTILKNDIVPKAKNNIDYFKSMNFTIYQNSTGKVVDPKEWDASKYNSYRYVQKGGTGNTLGRVKFMFKNNHSVYLHDTPNKSNFNRQFRDISSGCVRVQDPFELAEFILDLQENDITKQEIDNILQSQKTTNISVSKHPIGVFLLYWTLNLDKNLSPSLINDIYKYDTALYKKLIAL